MGPIEKRILADSERNKMPVPKRIQEAPDLVRGLELYYTGFCELVDSRTIGMAPGPIPWYAVQQYCAMNDLTEEQTFRMHHHIRKMDAAFLEFKTKRS
jgi:hypothetical protein